MFTSESTSTTVKSNVNLVEQILEQGQRLRNSMVKTILDNDPFILESELMDSKRLASDVIVKATETHGEETRLSTEDKHRVLAYLRGERMPKQAEKKVLETFRAMSNTDIVDITERSYHSDYSCNCDTCKEYYKHNLSCDFNHSNTVLCNERDNVPPLELHKFSEGNNVSLETLKSLKYVRNCLKYVDCLRVSVHSIVLNQEGIKKVYGTSSNQKLKLPLSISHTYFIEYHIPNIISKCAVRSKAKVNSGLDANTAVRMCSRRLQNEAIYFKQISMHDISNLENINLSTVEIKFQVSCRTYKQKSTNILGTAKFNMTSFLNSKTFCIDDDLLLMLNIDAPIVIGKLKVNMELGCGQLYFGEEFLNAIRSSSAKTPQVQENTHLSDEAMHVNTEIFDVEDDVHPTLEVDDNFNDLPQIVTQRLNPELEFVTKKTVVTLPTKETKVGGVKNVAKVEEIGNKQEKLGKQIKKTVEMSGKSISVPVVYNNQVLFGFFCVVEAQFLGETNDTCVSCRPFCKEDVLRSRLIHETSAPLYNFHQVLPFIYDDNFLNKLRDNFMIFEFWNKSEYQEDLIGICKIPLHQFYVAYRNTTITKYLERNGLPVIGCDWWEPVCDPLSGEIFGQAQILVALGTEVQIHNLKLERGFSNECVTAKTTHNRLKITQKTVDAEKSRKIFAKKSIVPKVVAKPNYLRDRRADFGREKIDIGTQSEIKMSEGNKTVVVDENLPNAQEAFSSVTSFLKHLMELNQKNVCVENSTNTDDDILPEISKSLDNPNVKNTSELLDSLQQALSISKTPTKFKAHIVVENALHLPGRKKSKSKKSRSKNSKPEEILPTCYVSFETTPDDIKFTPVVHKSKNPVWNFNSEVEIPADMLLNNEKRLIFKVWKKSNNCGPHPNRDLDTVLGFAGVDLTVLMAGLPSISGWFNILDFSSKCNGQIKISVTPLENLSKFTSQRNRLTSFAELNATPVPSSQEQQKTEEPGELLNRALKRKFTELDEITQRLRLRLSHVTNDESDTSNDDVADEFERDINTLCIEEDFDLVNFENGAQRQTQVADGALLQVQNCNFIYKNSTYENSDDATEGNVDSMESEENDVPSIKVVDAVGPLDRHLAESKQKLNVLFEKLALLTTTHNDPVEVFNSRHISGCSVSQDHHDNVANSNKRHEQLVHDISNSTSTSVSSCIETRLAPDGAGNK